MDARTAMAREDESFDLDENGRAEFVPAVFGRSIEEAEKYRQLLDDHDIPAIIGDDEDVAEGDASRRQGMTRGVPVLVPEAMLDEASEVIADREELDEYEISEDNLDAEDEDDEGFPLGEELDLEDRKPFETEDDEDEFVEDEEEDEKGSDEEF